MQFSHTHTNTYVYMYAHAHIMQSQQMQAWYIYKKEKVFFPVVLLHLVLCFCYDDKWNELIMLDGQTYAPNIICIFYNYVYVRSFVFIMRKTCVRPVAVVADDVFFFFFFFFLFMCFTFLFLSHFQLHFSLCNCLSISFVLFSAFAFSKVNLKLQIVPYA